MSDVHDDWKDYGQCNYTVCARMDPVSGGNNVTVRQMERSFETKMEMEREATMKKRAKAEPRVHRGII